MLVNMSKSAQNIGFGHIVKHKNSYSNSNSIPSLIYCDDVIMTSLWYIFSITKWRHQFMVLSAINDKFDEWELRGVIILRVLWTTKI